eukprot:Tbor_TRINITY_DN5354_c0_g6::TRINITY_DN5354_c0_g6_i1::g.4617::m.4617
MPPKTRRTHLKDKLNASPTNQESEAYRQVAVNPKATRCTSTGALSITPLASLPLKQVSLSLGQQISSDTHNSDSIMKVALRGSKVSYGDTCRSLAGILGATIEDPVSVTTDKQVTTIEEKDGMRIIASALPTIAHALFLYANLYWSQVGTRIPQCSVSSSVNNYYVVRRGSTESARGRSIDAVLSLPQSPSKYRIGTDSLCNTVSLSPCRSPASSKCAFAPQGENAASKMPSIPIDDRLLGAVIARCPFRVTKDHIAQVSKGFPTLFEIKWRPKSVPRLYFLDHQKCPEKYSEIDIPSRAALDRMLLDRFGSIDEVVKCVISVTSANTERDLMDYSLSSLTDLSGTCPKTTVDSLGSNSHFDRNSTTQRYPPGSACEVGTAVGKSMCSMSSALNSSRAEVEEVGEKRPRDPSEVSTIHVPKHLAAALLPEKLNEVASAAAMDHMMAHENLSGKLQEKIDIERMLSLYDLVRSIFGPSKVILSGARLLQQVCEQSLVKGDPLKIKKQLEILTLLGSKGSGLDIQKAPFSFLLPQKDTENELTLDFENSFVKLDRTLANRKDLSSAVAELLAEKNIEINNVMFV